MFRDLLARETQAPPWRDLVRIYRRLEMSGELRGGRFVGGFVGEQFAHARRGRGAARRRGASRSAARSSALSACDPLNLVGIITPGPRVPAALPNIVVYEDGVPQQPCRAAVLGRRGPALGRGRPPPVKSRSDTTCR